MNIKAKQARQRWREKHPERDRQLHWRANVRRHGISDIDYFDILQEQGYRCAICNAKPEDLRTLAIDHDHAHCPEAFGCEICVRGLLCTTCNAGLAMFRDSPALLRRAITYLTRSNSWLRKRS